MAEVQAGPIVAISHDDAGNPIFIDNTGRKWTATAGRSDWRLLDEPPDKKGDTDLAASPRIPHQRAAGAVIRPRRFPRRSLSAPPPAASDSLVGYHN